MEETVENCCGQCSKPSKTKCSRCKTTYYCGVECQKKDWKDHKKFCKSNAVNKKIIANPPTEPEGENVATDNLILSVKVDKSTVHGKGVFATKSIAMGERICFFHGKLKEANVKVRIAKFENQQLSIREAEKVFQDQISQGKSFFANKIYMINFCRI